MTQIQRNFYLKARAIQFESGGFKKFEGLDREKSFAITNYFII